MFSQVRPVRWRIICYSQQNRLRSLTIYYYNIRWVMNVTEDIGEFGEAL